MLGLHRGVVEDSATYTLQRTRPKLLDRLKQAIVRGSTCCPLTAQFHGSFGPLLRCLASGGANPNVCSKVQPNFISHLCTMLGSNPCAFAALARLE